VLPAPAARFIFSGHRPPTWLLAGGRREPVCFYLLVRGKRVAQWLSGQALHLVWS